MNPRETLLAFDAFLGSRALRLDAVIIGGAALNLLGIVQRPTRDCDVLHPKIPPDVLTAAREFAMATRSAGTPLDDDWLNNGPQSLVDQLPPGWDLRLQDILSGTSMRIRCLGRIDLLRSKLFALCDRATDLLDCVAMAPTADELDLVMPWLTYQDANPDWPDHVRTTMSDLRARCGLGL